LIIYHNEEHKYFKFILKTLYDNLWQTNIIGTKNSRECGVLNMDHEITFFDENSDFYSQSVLPFDYYFINFIKNHGRDEAKLLDIGGGNGNFSNLITENCPDINVTILDPSKKLLSEIENPKITKIIGELPDEIPLNGTFDYIHIKEVLHHITGKTVSESNMLLKESLMCVNDLLDKNGFLFIHEDFYEGYVIKKMPSYLIFYLLKIQNMLKVELPVKEFILGLKVYFYSRKELKKTLKECGFEIVDIKLDYWSNTTKKKIMLLKEWGRVLIIAKKSRNKNESACCSRI
jgi:ubiquinone/menaquinone biosynthesis C-methylase UbiE